MSIPLPSCSCPQKHLTALLVRILFLFLLPATTHAQVPTWQMAATPTSTEQYDHSTVQATASDATGNVYLTGVFTGTTRFGQTTLTSAGDNDVFIVKWSPVTNDFVWAKSVGSRRREVATAIAVAGNSVYVAGYFNSETVAFGSTTLTNREATAIFVRNDAFVTKLIDAGTSSEFAWTQQIGGIGEDDAKGLAVRGNELYVGGTFAGETAQLGNLTVTNASTGSGNPIFSDVYLAKLLDAGESTQVIWAYSAGDPASGDDLGGIALSGNSVYLTGIFTGKKSQFGSTILTSTTEFAQDIFVAKLLDAGTSARFIWAQRIGGSHNEFVHAITASGDKIYLVGHFRSATVEVGTTTLVNKDAGGTDILVAKLLDAGTSGHVVWAKRAGSLYDDTARGIVVTGNSVYITGIYKVSAYNTASADFGNFTLTSTGNGHLFIAKLVDAGTTADYAWAHQTEGSGGAQGNALTVSGNRLYVGGFYLSSSIFGATTLSMNGKQTGFLAALSDNTILGISKHQQLAGVDVYPNPAHGTTTVRVPLTAGTAPIHYTLTDALGRVVRTFSAQSGNTELDLTGLLPGLYTLQLQAGNARSTRQLAVE